MDPLVQLLPEQWPQLREAYKKHWPFGVPGYYFLDTQISNPSIGPACHLRVYCPYGDVNNGMIALNVKGLFNEVVVIANSENTEKIEIALATTNIIDWNKGFCIPFADDVVLKFLPKLYSRFGLRCLREARTLKHYLSKNSQPYDLTIPLKTYTGPLKLENIPQVDKAWPHRYSTSPKFFELLIENGLTYGLFSTEDNSLLAWITICEAGFLTHLYCEEEHRKKGYAEYITKFVCNDHLKKGKDVFCYIVEGNNNSMKLFRKLGFQIIGRGVWTFIGREGSNSNL